MTTKKWNWCTYSHINGDIPQHIGKVYDIRGSSCNVKYSEDQMYARHCWDTDYVRVFESLEGAICYMYTNSGLSFMSEIKQDLSYRFTKAARYVNWDTVLRPLKIKKMLKNLTK